MKTYDEIYDNVIKATDDHRKKIHKIQNTVSVSAVCLTCILGVGMFAKIERPATVPSSSNTTATTTTMTTDEMMQIIDTTASAPAINDYAEPPTTISRRIPGEVFPETTAEPTESEFSAVHTNMSESMIFSDPPEETTAFYEQDAPEYTTAAPEEKSSSAVHENVPTTTKPTIPPQTETESPPEILPPVSETATEPAETEGPYFQETDVSPAPEDPSPTECNTEVLEPSEGEAPEPVQTQMTTMPAETTAVATSATTTEEETTTTTTTFYNAPAEPESDTSPLTPEEWRALFGDAEYSLVNRTDFIEVTLTITEEFEEYFEIS